MKVTVHLYGHFRKFGDLIALELPPGSRVRDLERAFILNIVLRDPAFYDNAGLRASRFCDCDSASIVFSCSSARR